MTEKKVLCHALIHNFFIKDRTYNLQYTTSTTTLPFSSFIIPSIFMSPYPSITYDAVSDDYIPNYILNAGVERVKEALDRIDEKISDVILPSSSHVSNNSQRQKEIFEALSLQDLNKIILNLRDDN